MSAFEDITAADFDRDESIDELTLTGSADRWYNAAGELNVNAIQNARERAIKQSDVPHDILFSPEGLKNSFLSELTSALLALSSSDNRPHILQLTGPYACILLDAIQTVRVFLISSSRCFPMKSVARYVQAGGPCSSSALVHPHQISGCESTTSYNHISKRRRPWGCS
jgi:hypothetical protein